MNKIIYSGIILLIAVVIFIVLIVQALHTTPWLWLAVIGQIAVSYGIFVWHMGIIHSYQASQKA